jgi:hypothetical protein
MRMSRLPLAAFLLTLLVAPRVARAAGSEASVYSQLGIGDPRGIAGIRYAGMGFTGFALHDAASVSALSPAAWSTIRSTQVDAGFLYEGYSSTDGTNSRYLAGGGFAGGMLAIPFSTAEGVVLGFGFVPLSTVSYSTYDSGSEGGMDYDVKLTGTGGFTRAQIGLSWAPLSDLAVGGAFAFVFGSVLDERTLIPLDPDYAGGTVRDRVSGQGPGMTAGLRFEGFDRLTPSLKGVALGLFVASRVTMKTTTELTYAYTSDRDTLDEVSGTAAIPAAFGLGLSWQIDELYLVAADYRSQAWSTADLASLRGGDVRDARRFSIGGERTGSREPSAPWVQRLTVRAGGFYENTYYAPGGTGIDAWGVTAGLSMPIGADTWLNLSAEYGTRGTTDNGLVRDKIFRLGMGLNFSELWFVRYEEE